MKKVGFFTDDKGNLSILRLLAFLIGIAGIIDMLSWSYVSVMTLTIPDFPYNLMAIIVGVIGVGKPLQKFFENFNFGKNNEQPRTDSE